MTIVRTDDPLFSGLSLVCGRLDPTAGLEFPRLRDEISEAESLRGASDHDSDPNVVLLVSSCLLEARYSASAALSSRC